MKARPVAVILKTTLLIGLGWTANLLATYFSPKPPEWTTIRTFTGDLSKGQSVVVRISYSAYFSDGTSRAETYLQNKILVESAGRKYEFQWEDSLTYAAKTADVLDLDQDGRKEFVMLSGGSARVVSFVDGRFIFRPQQDELFFAEGDLAIVAESSPRYFAIVKPSEMGTTGPITEVARWNSTRGFLNTETDHDLR